MKFWASAWVVRQISHSVKKKGLVTARVCGGSGVAIGRERERESVKSIVFSLLNKGEKQKLFEIAKIYCGKRRNSVWLITRRLRTKSANRKKGVSLGRKTHCSWKHRNKGILTHNQHFKKPRLHRFLRDTVCVCWC